MKWWAPGVICLVTVVQLNLSLHEWWYRPVTNKKHKIHKPDKGATATNYGLQLTRTNSHKTGLLAYLQRVLQSPSSGCVTQCSVPFCGMCGRILHWVWHKLTWRHDLISLGAQTSWFVSQTQELAIWDPVRACCSRLASALSYWSDWNQGAGQIFVWMVRMVRISVRTIRISVRTVWISVRMVRICVRISDSNL